MKECCILFLYQESCFYEECISLFTKDLHCNNSTFQGKTLKIYPKKSVGETVHELKMQREWDILKSSNVVKIKSPIL